MRMAGWACLLNLVALVGLLGTPRAAQAQKTYADKIGVDLDGLGDGNRGKPFADLAITLRPWSEIGGKKPVAVDEHGWPKSDAVTVLFDVRPFPAWNPPIDDPAAFQVDWSGTYKMSFQGQAEIKFVEETRPKLPGRNMTRQPTSPPPI